MKYSDHILNLLAAKSYRGIGRKWINDNLANWKTPGEVVRLLEAKVPEVTIDDFMSRRDEMRNRINRLGEAVDGITGIGDPDFPMVGNGVKAADRPFVLFYRGNIDLLRSIGNNVAVIGLLNPTEEIAAAERNVVAELVRRGKCIVSGLALGCDSIGHLETLKNGGKTVAFLASPLFEVNPPSNRGLAEEIVKNGGLLVSEYLDRAHSRTEFLGRYPERDRLQAMYASTVVLAASYAPNNFKGDCGSRFALNKAKEYGIPRAVIYDRAKNYADRMFDLNRDEIMAGAMVVDPNCPNAMQIVGCAPAVSEQMFLGI